MEIKPSTLINNVTDNISNDPTIINFDLLTEEKKDGIVASLSSLFEIIKASNPNASFKDLVNYYAENKSLAGAEKAYDLLFKGYKLSQLPGYESIDYDSVYFELFHSTIDFQSILELSNDDFYGKSGEIETEQKVNPEVNQLPINLITSKDVIHQSWFIKFTNKHDIITLILFWSFLGILLCWHFDYTLGMAAKEFTQLFGLIFTSLFNLIISILGAFLIFGIFFLVVRGSLLILTGEWLEILQKKTWKKH